MASEGGSAAILGSPDSLFVALLADDWQRRGFEVSVVTWGSFGSRLPDGVKIIDVARERRTVWDWFLRGLEPIALPIQSGFIRLGRNRFRRISGKDQPEPWEGSIWVWLENAWRLARAVDRLKPTFVLGCEAMAYGLATSLCRTRPRILFPFGGDVYNSAETWWAADRQIGHALRTVERVLPSSSAARDHIIERFAVPSERVRAISWGADLKSLIHAPTEQRRSARERWQIPSASIVVVNSRRFRPVWGSDVILKAFLQSARTSSNTHYVLIGGPGASEELAAARREIDAAGLEKRFLLIDRELTLAEYHDLALTAEIFTSVMPRCDMRSSSVLELAAAGAAPVIGDVAEYRCMERGGFQASFPPCDNPGAVAQAIRTYADDESLRSTVREANWRYLTEHEDRRRQFDLIWAEIQTLVAQAGQR
jgi:glycosyltransferase involved in cell wall biosynthesis